jgi:hypothetical protein
MSRQHQHQTKQTAADKWIVQSAPYLNITGADRLQDVRSRGVPPFLESPLSLSDIEEAVGDPSRVSRKGKAHPLEAGRGRDSPPAKPYRATA